MYAGTHCHDGRPIHESARYQEAIRRGIPIVHSAEKTERKAEGLWVDRYAPTSLSHIIGHKDSIAQLSQWLRTWSSQKSALITGPPGIGKTSTVHLLAKEHGYTVVEYNASDTRSIAKLKGLFALGIRRLRKELIVMDEVDGFTAQDRGGVGELADLIRSSTVPIVCIGNKMTPKLAPLQKVSLVVPFSRPVKSTIATALMGICKKEKLTLSKVELETLCEQSGNDIRAILNHLQCSGGDKGGEKDSLLRLDLFSATQKLMSNRRASLQEADDYVYVDYGMVPLMVQEAYAAASRTLDEVVAASEQVSFGDLLSKRQWSTQDWSLLPHVVHSTVAVSRKVTGPCPFQIFPRILGKNATRGKHRRWMEEVGRCRGRSAASVRLDEVGPLQRILLAPLLGEKVDKPVIQGVMGRMDVVGVNRDQMEYIGESVWNPVAVPTKVKTAFTREYNKVHSRVKRVSHDEEEEQDEDEEEEDKEDDL